MSDMKKDTFMGRMKEGAKNKGLVYASAAIVAVSTGLMFHQCGKSASSPVQDIAPLCEPVRGDNRCCESESSVYLRGPDGKILMAMVNGRSEKVRNPHYSLEDCHGGDGVWQGQTDPAKVLNAAGEPAGPLMERYLDGRQITLPLEDENSFDAYMQKVRDDPCGPLVEGGKRISRPRISNDLIRRELVQRSQGQIEEMHLHPESLRPGDNYFVTINSYEETCDSNLPVCTPDMVTACFCANHAESDCQAATTPPPPPPPPRCGNSQVDSGEACDPRSRRARGGCPPENHCTPACTCERDSTPPRCGDNLVNGSEECDPAGSSCGEGGTCSPQCRCNEPVRPIAPAGGLCPTEVTSLFRGRANALKTGSALSTVRQACGYDSDPRAITVTVQVRVSGGFGHVESIGGSGCSGIPTSLVNLSGIPAGVDSCVSPVTVTIPPG